MKRNLKSITLVAFFILLLFVLTGCANVNYEIKLEKDGSGDVSYIMGYDKSFLSSMQVSIEDLQNDDSFDEMKQEATKTGYTVEAYEDDNTYGFKAFKHVNNIQNEFSIEPGSDKDDGIKYEKTLLKTKYSQDAAVDLADVTGSAEDAITKAVLGQMKITYKVVLPFKAGDNNATLVSEDGKTLEWTLKVGQTNEIKFVAEEDRTVYLVAGIAVIVLIIVLSTIVVMANKKKGKKQEVKTTKTVEIKKEASKDEKEVKTAEVKEAKKEEPKKEVSKEIKTVKEEKATETKKVPAKEVKKEDTKKEQPKKEVKKETKKEEPKKEAKKEKPKTSKKQEDKKEEDK